MKGLITILGLLLALFVSSVKADIYTIATNYAPKIESVTTYLCSPLATSLNGKFNPYRTSDFSSCLVSIEQALDSLSNTSESSCSHRVSGDDYIIDCAYSKWNANLQQYLSGYELNGAGILTQKLIEDSRSCPPDSFPNYVYDVDFDGDGQIDKCYDPNELDNLSNCAAEQGQVLNGANSSHLKVCKTDPSSGVSCGYSRPSLDSGGFMLNLEMNCFGSDNDVPEYDNEPLPDPLPNCNDVNDQLQVCEADPLQRCRNQYDCDDQCGYVEGKFVCFSGSDNPIAPDETVKDDTDPTDTDVAIPTDADIGDLMQLTQNKANGTVYAINQKSNQIINSIDSMHKTLSDKLTLGKNANSKELQRVQDLLQKLVDKPVSGGGTDPGGEEPAPEETPWPNPTDFTVTKEDLAPSFDHTAIDAEIEVSKQALIDKFFAIRDQFTQTFQLDLTSAASLPCLGTIEYETVSKEICLQPYAEQLNWVGIAMVFGFTLFGFVIIFK